MSDTASEPRLSSTILLLRDNPELEVLMVKRHYEIDFAAGALVFPGGKAHEEDESQAWDDLVDGEYETKDRTARIAALREAYEEAGIVLARHVSNRGTGQPLVGRDVAEALDPMREAVDKREASFLDLIKQHDLVLALDTMVHYGHWITPTMMPKRFDTHFYLAPTPPNQIAVNDGRETTEAVWLGPQQALDMEAKEECTIIFPTRMNLGKLASASKTIDAVDQFGGVPVVTVLPIVGKDDDGNPCLHIPAEAGYPQTIEPLGKVASGVGGAGAKAISKEN
ncbi:MAG: NUDIX domain-containing protein [Pseudomonadota bacterium]